MEIGSKLKEARMKTEFTQEQVAEEIGVSRQTISNWENEGKEDTPMTNYIEYLEESTNMVKSKQRFSKVLQLGIYVLLWTSCLVWFWIGKDYDSAQFAPAFAVMALYLILPISTFVISFFIGKDESWGRYRWLMALFFGGMHSMECFATFAMANTLTFGNLYFSTVEDAIPAIIISLLGIGCGAFVKQIKNKNK